MRLFVVVYSMAFFLVTVGSSLSMAADIISPKPNSKIAKSRQILTINPAYEPGTYYLLDKAYYSPGQGKYISDKDPLVFKEKPPVEEVNIKYNGNKVRFILAWKNPTTKHGGAKIFYYTSAVSHESIFQAYYMPVYNALFMIYQEQITDLEQAHDVFEKSMKAVSLAGGFVKDLSPTNDIITGENCRDKLTTEVYEKALDKLFPDSENVAFQFAKETLKFSGSKAIECARTFKDSTKFMECLDVPMALVEESAKTIETGLRLFVYSDITQKMKLLTIERDIVMQICKTLDEGDTAIDIPRLIRELDGGIYALYSLDLDLVANIQNKRKAISEFWTAINK